MSTTPYNADTTLMPPLAVTLFVSGAPGNVAVCLSGGGSRAMTAAMGQLRALESLDSGNASLLSQTKMLSTVSGGSWAGVPFTFLTPGTTDDKFLGGPYTAPGALTVPGISTLDEGCVASGITSHFTLIDLAAHAVGLAWAGTPVDMLWQVLIGLAFLHPYGLFKPAKGTGLPTSYFSFDKTTAAAIQEANPGNALATETPDMVAQVSGQTRPYLLCNMSMNVPQPQSPSQPTLVPVQGTPFFTGIAGSPGVNDVNGRPVGGGGVTSFAFNSVPTAVSGSAVSVTQSRQWSLVDIVGTSSAAFAETLISIFKDFAAMPPHFAAALQSNRDAILRKVELLGLDRDRAAISIEEALSAVARGDIQAHQANFSFDWTAIVPSYRYWSPANIAAGDTVNASFFADAGSLDNTGVASALAYSDIQNVIAFMNSMTLLKKDGNSVIVVDDMIPPLFGYQPYDAKKGYASYTERLVTPKNAAFANNQIFASDQFDELLNGLWAASGSGTYLNSPIFTQPLTTLENTWFGVAGNRAVTVLWVYLENTVSWSKALSPEVRPIESGLVSSMHFPHYDTFQTELTPQEINLLANLTAWTVMSNAAAFQAMYAS